MNTSFMSPDLIVGDDGLARTPWAATSKNLRDYYDTEWGEPIYSEQGLYERLVLESFQAGLSWSTVLNKRETLREAFDGFDVDSVAAFNEARVHALLNTPGIIRNEKKIRAAITNAQATIALRTDGGLSQLIWSHLPSSTPCPMHVSDIPSTSEESAALARELKKRGFVFVGPTTMYALMAAIGMVDLHLVGSHRRGCSQLFDATGALSSRETNSAKSE